VGYRRVYTKNQGVEVEEHWEELGYCYGRRNLGDFSNLGCMCLSWVILWSRVEVLYSVCMLNSLVSGITLSSNVALNATYLT